ncbi:MBL fold metallo-hydrolase [Actinopolymorpha alba]|uniref:MBL fold metallo-hydrolase n=1 Tax=Actinopolymorpha alba TaxID=533267 RepID=UPI0003823033|nr:MBL fold metallo-hydrolase [Actinopolymorpha alba]
MFVAGFPTGVFAANCYIVAAARGAECVVIDPGQDAAPAVAEVVREHRLKPVAVALTHGHLDHMWSVLPVCGSYDAVCWVHPADRSMLADPLAGLPREWASALLGAGATFAEPDDVRPLADGMRLELAGLSFTVDHTPGHTSGSVTFRTPSDPGSAWEPHGFSRTVPAEDAPELMFSGDLLFAGSIGRTDLPGGDHKTILRSLADKVLPLDDRIVVLPGHGDQTTIGRERQTNPFLQGLVPGPAPSASASATAGSASDARTGAPGGHAPGPNQSG